jgi:hypothetical protein
VLRNSKNRLPECRNVIRMRDQNPAYHAFLFLFPAQIHCRSQFIDGQASRFAFFVVKEEEPVMRFADDFRRPRDVVPQLRWRELFIVRHGRHDFTGCLDNETEVVCSICGHVLSQCSLHRNGTSCRFSCNVKLCGMEPRTGRECVCIVLMSSTMIDNIVIWKRLSRGGKCQGSVGRSRPDPKGVLQRCCMHGVHGA